MLSCWLFENIFLSCAQAINGSSKCVSPFSVNRRKKRTFLLSACISWKSVSWGILAKRISNEAKKVFEAGFLPEICCYWAMLWYGMGDKLTRLACGHASYGLSLLYCISLFIHTYKILLLSVMISLIHK
jgi:hypothetical protein